MADRLHAVVIGASSGVGRAIAEALAIGGNAVVIVSRSQEDLDTLAFHLELTTEGTVTPLVYDIASDNSGADELCAAALKALGRVDVVFLTAAAVSEADRGLTPGPTADSLINVNLVGPIHVLTAFASVLEKQCGGTLVVFSSIAAAVLRRNNMVYSTAKVGLEGFCHGLRHYLSKFGARVQIYRLGYVDTSMAAGRTRLFPKEKPEFVANHVIRHLGDDSGLSYYPRYWRFVVFALRLLPWSVFRRLDF